MPNKYYEAIMALNPYSQYQPRLGPLEPYEDPVAFLYPEPEEIVSPNPHPDAPLFNAKVETGIDWAKVTTDEEPIPEPNPYPYLKGNRFRYTSDRWFDPLSTIICTGESYDGDTFWYKYYEEKRPTAEFWVHREDVEFLGTPTEEPKPPCKYEGWTHDQIMREYFGLPDHPKVHYRLSAPYSYIFISEDFPEVIEAFKGHPDCVHSDPPGPQMKSFFLYFEPKEDLQKALKERKEQSDYVDCYIAALEARDAEK